MSEITRPPLFNCLWGECRSAFLMRAAFIDHVTLHLNEEGAPCKWRTCKHKMECGEGVLQFNRHVYRHCRKQRPFKCWKKGCEPREFASRIKLQRHLDSEHGGAKQAKVNVDQKEVSDSDGDSSSNYESDPDEVEAVEVTRKSKKIMEAIGRVLYEDKRVVLVAYDENYDVFMSGLRCLVVVADDDPGGSLPRGFISTKNALEVTKPRIHLGLVREGMFALTSSDGQWRRLQREGQ